MRLTAPRLASFSNIVVHQSHQLPPVPQVQLDAARSAALALAAIKPSISEVLDNYGVVVGRIELRADPAKQESEFEGEESETVNPVSLEQFSAALLAAREAIRLETARSDGTSEAYPFNPLQKMIHLDQNGKFEAVLSYPSFEPNVITLPNPDNTLAPFDYSLTNQHAQLERNKKLVDSPKLGKGRISDATLAKLKGKSLESGQLELVAEEIVMESESNTRLLSSVMSNLHSQLTQDLEAKIVKLQEKIDLATAKTIKNTKTTKTTKKKTTPIVKAKKPKLVVGQSY